SLASRGRRPTRSSSWAFAPSNTTSSAVCDRPRCCKGDDSEATEGERSAESTHRYRILRSGRSRVAWCAVTQAPDPKLMDRVVNLAKRRGLVFPSSDIYGGFRSTWDYGPLGVLLK